MPETATVGKTYLVVLALYELGGEADLETIAVKVHEMFPGQFSWRSYPEYPDKDAVRVHLSEAKKGRFGRLVADRDLRKEPRTGGGYTKRFALTKEGLEKAKALESLTKQMGIGASKNPLDYKRIIEPILESAAFRQFKSGRAIGEIGRDGFLLAFKLFADAGDFVIKGRLARSQAAVSRMPDSTEKAELLRFIEEGRTAHAI